MCDTSEDKDSIVLIFFCLFYHSSLGTIISQSFKVVVPHRSIHVANYV